MGAPPLRAERMEVRRQILVGAPPLGGGTYEIQAAVPPQRAERIQFREEILLLPSARFLIAYPRPWGREAGFPRKWERGRCNTGRMVPMED